jgi:Fungal Zn(2)-Cys(6) binuclear cluster domain
MFNNPPPPPSYPLLPRPQNMTRKKPPNMSLIKSCQWPSLDAQAYPSPPMTNSPTSPKRSQFSEERPVHVHEAATAPPSASIGPPRPMMGSQVLPPPSSVPPFMFSMPGPPLPYGHDPQPRRRSQSIPPYQLSYPRPPDMLQQSSLPPPVMTTHGQLIPGTLINTSTGAVSLATVVGKIARAGTRRTKAHVARACQNCKKAHLSCDDERPCTRCVATRKEVSLKLRSATLTIPGNLHRCGAQKAREA